MSEGDKGGALSCLRSSLMLGVGLSALLVGCREEVRVPDPPDTAAVTNAANAIVAAFGAAGDCRRLSVKDMRVEDFRRELMSVSPQATLWMPGEHDWLLLGVGHGMTNSMDRAMEAFSELDCKISFAGIFCAYVGTVAEAMPAFDALQESAIVSPQNFVTKEIPPLTWLAADDVDEDIRKEILAEIRAVQAVRREVIRGNMLAAAAKSRNDERAAIEMWSQAASRNPDDTFLAERLERLGRNAAGFRHLGKVLQAMKCYETMMRIRPTAVNVHNFGMCLKRIGKFDLAEKVLARARELEKAENSAVTTK